ncbi:MAG: hypothetical protein SCH71_07175 [Desulfobulbaceae bacterium]|nr:hypothetical protein [Desulfobulbaceae bacterium]
MMGPSKAIIALFFLLLVAAVIARDSRFHFHTDSLRVKREHHSPLRDWTIGNNQQYLYHDSPFRYQSDLVMIAGMIEPGHALLSDLATSYYAAATLPVYVLNVHRHHRSTRAAALAKVLRKNEFCYLEDSFHRQKAIKFLQRDTRAAGEKNWPALRYFLLNKDKENSMLWKDCLAMRSDQLEVSLLQISKLLYEGEYLNIYEFNIFSDSL